MFVQHIIYLLYIRTVYIAVLLLFIPHTIAVPFNGKITLVGDLLDKIVVLVILKGRKQLNDVRMRR